MKPKYNTWIRLKKMLFITLIFLCILIAMCVFNNIFIKPILFILLLPFGYMSIVLLLSYYFFSENGGNYQSIVHDKIVGRITSKTGVTILDIGAGSGSLSVKAAKNNKQFEIKAIDYWGSNWEYSKKQCLDNAVLEGVDQQIEFIKASASKLPFANNTFDTIMSCLTFHEVEDTKDKSLVIEEAIRTLKVGGQFVFFDLFGDEKLFGDIHVFLSKISHHTHITEFIKTDEFLHDCPKILLHKKVLGNGALISGIKI